MEDPGPGKYQALKTFNSEEFGMIRTGSTVWLPPDYANQLKKLGSIKPAEKRAAKAAAAPQGGDPREPGNRQAHPGAPLGKEQPAPGTVPAEPARPAEQPARAESQPEPEIPGPDEEREAPEPSAEPQTAGQAPPSVVSPPVPPSRGRMRTGAGGRRR